MINRNFLLAGKATFTIANSNGERYTYKVVYSKKIEKYFAYVLTGPDNTRDYTYVGMLKDDYLIPTKKSKYTNDSKIIKVFRFAVDIMNEIKKLPEGYFLDHEGHCGRCGRSLTTPESIKLGLGPVCKGK